MLEHQPEAPSTRLTITSLCQSSHPHKRPFDSVHQDYRLDVNHDTKGAPERKSPEDCHATTLDLSGQSPKFRDNVQHKDSLNTSVKIAESLPNRISLPSFRESFPFAVSETAYDYGQPHYLSIPPPPLRLQPSPEYLIRPVSNIKAHPESLSNLDRPLWSHELPFFKHRLSYGGANSDTSSSSTNGDWTDNTCSTACVPGVCFGRGTSLSDRNSFNYLSNSRNPPVKVSSAVQSFDLRTIATQDVFPPAVKRARTISCHSDDFASCDDQRFSSPSQTPPALSTAAWPSASPTPNRSRAYGRQDWQTHATREADGSWRCTWVEDELTCTYKSKKQATKRHIELKHMKMKPHPCCYCGRTFGQRTTLDVHMATHTGQKDHVCTDYGCTERYSDASRLLRHRVAVHGYMVRKTAPKQLNCLGHKASRKKTRSRVTKQ